MHEGDGDEALMLEIARGDHRAFRILMSRHMERAVRLAEAVLRSASDADEIAQEAFVRVWKASASFDPSAARFTTWLYRIVVNLAIDRSRRPRADPLEAAEHVAADEPGALAELIAKEEQEAMGQGLSGLPDRQRVAIALFHFEELSARDAAQAMGVSEKAFESLLTRARAALRQRVLEAAPRSRRKP
jgi:RNA polymerase sigma-70 factor (ECF subfamily)